jgi:hypothetical protein
MPERGKISGTNTYQSTHWDQPNVLAHIRINDRVAQAPGFVVRNTKSGNRSEVFATREQAEAYQAKLPASLKTEIREEPRDVRVLFVEEVQSDWGQDGKKKGLADSTELNRLRAELKAARAAEADALSDALSANDSNSDAAGEALKAAEQKTKDIAKAVDAETRRTASMVPAAPFVTKTEGWLNLALKRIAMMAVEGGYDKVAFVNGEQSADRYDLSKQIDSIRYTKNDNGTYRFAAMRGGQAVSREERATASRLEDLAGKEIAQKIVSGEGVQRERNGNTAPYTELAGLDLKVGGQGMIKFYDQIVPQALNKLLPKIGGEKLGAVNIGSMDTKQGREGDALLAQLGVEVEGKRPPMQPGFDVTDKMRETVGAGLPLFSRDRVTSTPEFKKWFGGSKVVDAEGKPMVMYHGTGFSFNEFTSYRGDLIYFAKTPKTAESYAKGVSDSQNEMGNYDDDFGRGSEDGGASIYPV